MECVAGHSVDEYLETIYFLAFPIGEYRPAGESAIASRVAEMLGVSRASAGEMLKRLEADGLVERGEQKEAILTEAGIESELRPEEDADALAVFVPEGSVDLAQDAIEAMTEPDEPGAGV